MICILRFMIMTFDLITIITSRNVNSTLCTDSLV